MKDIKEHISLTDLINCPGCRGKIFKALIAAGYTPEPKEIVKEIIKTVEIPVVKEIIKEVEVPAGKVETEPMKHLTCEVESKHLK